MTWSGVFVLHKATAGWSLVSLFRIYLLFSNLHIHDMLSGGDYHMLGFLCWKYGSSPSTTDGFGFLGLAVDCSSSSVTAVTVSYFVFVNIPHGLVH